jgi:hypothetical protein
MCLNSDFTICGVKALLSGSRPQRSSWRYLELLPLTLMVAACACRTCFFTQGGRNIPVAKKIGGHDESHDRVEEFEGLAMFMVDGSRVVV